MQISKTKKIILLLLTFLVSVTFSACASVRSITITNEDGTIDELVYVELDSAKFAQAGYNVEDVKLDIKNMSLQLARNTVENYNSRVQADIAMSFIISGNSLKFQKLQNGIEILGDAWKNDEFYIGLRFKNEDCYNYFYEIEKDKKVEPKYEKHFFHTKIVYEGYSKFVRYSELTKQLNNYYLEKYPMLAQEKAQLLYTLETSSVREHSDADYISHVGDKYYHTWKISEDELDKQISIYYRVANRANWLSICLCAGLGLSVIILIVGIIKTKINLKKEKIEENNLE